MNIIPHTFVVNISRKEVHVKDHRCHIQFHLPFNLCVCHMREALKSREQNRKNEKIYAVRDEAIHFQSQAGDQVEYLAAQVKRGRLGNSFLGRPIVLLTAIGHKSGKPRIQPVFFMRDGKRIVLVATDGGSPEDPA